MSLIFFISLTLYLIGILIVFLEIKNRRIQFIINWPYAIYGIGFPVLIYFLNIDIFPWLKRYIYNDIQILIAHCVMFFFLVSSHFIGKFILNNLSIISILEQIKNKERIPFTVFLLNSTGFKIYVTINFILFMVIYALALKSGELTQYNYREFAYYKYWGALAFITENLSILVLFYIYNLLFYKNYAQRSFIIEIMFIIFIVLRLLPGTRLFFAKIFIAFLLFSYMLKKLSLKRIFLIFFIGLVAFSWIGFYRLGLEFKLSILAIFSSYFMEAALNDLSLINAVYNLQNLIYFPLYPIGVFIYVLPKFIIDKASIVKSLYNKDAFANIIGIDYISPVGGMSFLGDLIIAYGNLFFIPLLFLLSIFYFLIKRIKTSMGLFILFAFSSTAINIWRDSFFISFKIILEHIFVNIFILFLFYLYFKKCEDKCSEKKNINSTS